MKKSISLCFLLLFAVIGNAQVNTKAHLNELSQDQLDLALIKSNNTIKVGKILTFSGLGISAAAIAISFVSITNTVFREPLDSSKGMMAAGFMIIIGAGSTLIGIPVWIGGASKKHKITLELAKFNSPVLAAINGVGLKIRF